MSVRMPTVFRAAAVALTLALSAPAAAATEPDLDLRYVVYWGGLRVADVALRYDEQPESENYHAALSARTRGLADVLTQYLGDAEVEGLLSANDGLAPVSYRADYRQRRTDRSTVLRFDPESREVTNIHMLKRGKPTETEVPPDLRLSVVDPVTAIFSLRRHTAEALAGEGPPRFTVGVIDGRRRYDLAAEVLGRRTAVVEGGERTVIEVRLRMVPLAGYDRDEMEAALDPSRYVIAQLSDDDRLIPLRLQSYGHPVTTVVRLVRDCSNGARCPSVTN
jgi:Protein of unknown function (DUF3108)